MKILRNTFHAWLPIAAAAALLTGVMYAFVQQTYRSNADDPQIQMAEDAAARLAAGESPDSVVPAGIGDLAVSLAPYLVIYDTGQQPIASNARLNGEIPPLPAGVLDVARDLGSNGVTHQPEPGVRMATFMVAVNGGADGYVLAGRSLREVEARVNRLGQMSLMGLAGTLVGTFVAAALVEAVPFLEARELKT